MNETRSFWRFQLVAALKVATRSSSTAARSGEQARSCIGPGTKITVLPATEN